MHNNYFFLNKLTGALRSRIVPGTVQAIYTQNRNELVVEVSSNNNNFYIKASVDPSFPCLSFPPDVHRARKNSVDLFEQLVGRPIQDIQPIPFDRSFYIQIEGLYRLLFKMHGNRSNVLLFERDRCIKLFRNNLRSDYDIRIPSLGNDVDLSKEAFGRVQGNYRKLAPVFGNAFDGFFAQRDYESKSLEIRWEIFSALLDHLRDPEYCLSKDGGTPVFRLFKDPETIFCSNDPIEGINRFYAFYAKTQHLRRAKGHVLSQLSSRISKTEGYLVKSSGKLEQLRTGQRYDQWADIIMANLHQIKKYQDAVVLFDFYHQGDVRIPLRKQLTPQENAANYYRKSKNQAIEIRQLSENIRARQQELEALKEAQATVQNMTDPKEIRAFAKTVLRQTGPSAEQDTEQFHRYHQGGWHILVGRNNRTNELLTFGKAHKNDYWLHIKDAPGSHVLIQNSGNTKPPKYVVEYAARIAAYHSKRRGESLCPVTVTQKKYVRKGKGMKPGQVLIDREDILLVAPLQKP